MNFTFVTFKHILYAKRAVQVTLFAGTNTNIRPIISVNQLIPSTAKSATVAAQIILDLARPLNWNAVKRFSSSLMWRPRLSVRLPSVCLIVTSYQRINRLLASHEILQRNSLKELPSKCEYHDRGTGKIVVPLLLMWFEGFGWSLVQEISM